VNILPASETGVFTAQQLEEERQQYISEDGDDLRFQQEYMCSFEGSVQGSYYGSVLDKIEKANHVGQYPCDPILPVHTVWDLGVSDATAIWFFQAAAGKIRVIDYLEAEGEGLAYYVQELQKKCYTYGKHFAPHDIRVREFGTGVSRLETAKSLGVNFVVVPQLGIQDGIQAVRLALPLCWFDEEATALGLSALKNYHKEYDEKRKIYKSSPTHDWSSHASDAFRYLAIAYNKFLRNKTNPLKQGAGNQNKYI